MSDDRGGARQIAPTVPETSRHDDSADGPFAEAERIEDTVPYIPPLVSYRIDAVWGEVRQGVPLIFPDEIFEDADDDA